MTSRNHVQFLSITISGRHDREDNKNIRESC